jgi:hypothetical protein
MRFSIPTQTNPNGLGIGKLISSVFAGIISETHEAIRDAGEDPDNYQVQAYPFTIIRMDGKHVGRHVLRAIEERLEVDRQ